MKGCKFAAMGVVMFIGVVLLSFGVSAAPHLATPGALLIIGCLLCGEIAEVGQELRRERAESAKKQ